MSKDQAILNKEEDPDKNIRSLVYTSVGYAKSSIPFCSIETLKKAIKWEKEHQNRSSLIKALQTGINKKEKELRDA